MSHDPFTPPASNVEVREQKRGSAVKAIVVGMVVDFAGSMILSFLFVVTYAAYLGATGQADQVAKFSEGFDYDSGPGLVLAVMGCLFSVLGGFICARIARHAEYRLGLIMATLSVALALVIDARASATYFVLAVLSFASVMTGIHLGARKNRDEAKG